MPATRRSKTKNVSDKTPLIEDIPLPPKRKVGRPRKNPAMSAQATEGFVPNPAPISATVLPVDNFASILERSLLDQQNIEIENENERYLMGLGIPLVQDDPSSVPVARNIPCGGCEKDYGKEGDEFELSDDDGYAKGGEEDYTNEIEEVDNVQEVMIPCLVPLKNGTSDVLEVPSNLTWQDVRFRLAEKMEIPAGSLNIGYKFSTHAIRDPQRCLSTVANWLDLVAKAHEAMKAKKKAKGKGKPFEVYIKDMNPPDAKGAKVTSEKLRLGGSGGIKGGSGGGSVESFGAANSRQEAFSEGRLVRLLELKTKCSKHDRNCAITLKGEHIRLQKEHLSLWAMLVARNMGDKDLIKPPDLVLNAAKTSSEARDHIAPPRGIVCGPKSIPKQINPFEAEDEMIAMDVDEIEDPRQFPLISSWLKEIDESPRADGRCYSQYLSSIETEGYKQISELADLVTGVELHAACSGMSMAIAKNLIQFAKSDTKKIRQMLKKGF